MNLTDELQKLADLHQAGHLTEAEFVEAKRKLIGDSRAETPGSPETGDATVETVASLPEKKFKSSRWSSGNMIFPDSLTLAADGLHFHKGALFGSSEERISYRAVASLKVKNGIFMADVTIETSGGSQPIFINGLWKSAAREIQELVRAYQLNAR
ncbi:MAG TPA: SHOCT domain-containing protein [Candidatus Limnocylindria bacterium]|nr:SHOCT domain-containing protein [Candidatus Limnocylindria bacterium]